LSTVASVVMICRALAWLVIRFAVCTAEPKMSRCSCTTPPKWQPTRIATWPCSCARSGAAVIRSCICLAAAIAWSDVANVDMTSSPMVLITVPPLPSVASRMISMQRPTMFRACSSPSCS
jgi:hypothetical protein